MCGPSLRQGVEHCFGPKRGEERFPLNREVYLLGKVLK